MTDVLADFTAKTIFKNGDINTGVSDDQHKRLLLMSEKGAYKEFPATCVGAASFLEDESSDALIREVRLQFVADGQTVKSVKYEDGKLKVDSFY